MIASVIIPTRNQCRQLDNTLKALSTQRTGAQYEVVVVDDSSADETARVCARHRVNYVLYRRQGDGREVAAARNLGANAAMGRLLIFLDSDMLVKQDFVESHVRLHRPGTVVLGLRQQLDEKGSTISADDEREHLFKACRDEPGRLPIPWVLLYSHNFSVAKSEFLKAGGFSTSFDRWGVEDQELGYRLHRQGVKFSIARKLSACHQWHSTEYANPVQKKVNLVLNSTKFMEMHNDPDIASYYGISRRAMHLDIGEKCNNNCRLCSCRFRHVSLQEICLAVADLPRDWGLVIRGGEPCIRKDFFSLLEALRGFGSTALWTNGRAFSYESFCRKCIRSGLGCYTVSVFGDEQSHDSHTRVPGSHRQAVAGIRNLLRLNQRVAVNLALEPSTNDVDMITGPFRKMGISSFHMSFIGDITLESFSAVRDLLRRPGIVLRDPFSLCYSEFLAGRKNLTAEMLRGCSACALIDRCGGEPWNMFSL